MDTSTPSLTHNFIMNGILGVSTFLFPLITLPYASRILLPEGIGKVSFAASVIAYFNMFAQLGIPTYGIRACARVRDDRKELTRTAMELLTINLVMSAAVYGVLGMALALVPRLRNEKTLYLVLSLTILLNAVGMEWLYKGLERYTFITVRSVAFKMIAAAALFLMVRERQDYILYGGVTVLASSASYVCNLIHAGRYVDLRLIWRERLRPLRHLKAVAVFFAMSCSVVIYTNLDTVMLGFMKSDADVGYYNAAVRVKVLLVSLVASLGSVLLPRVSYYAERGLMEEFRDLGGRALYFVFGAALPMTVYFMLFAGPSIFLLSGPAYGDSVLPMRIIMPTLLLIGITNILGIQILVPLGREKVVLVSEIAGAVTDLALNLLLIPALAAAGAAIGTLAAEGVVMAVQLWALRDQAAVLFRRVPWMKMLLASCAAGAAAWVIAEIWLADVWAGMKAENAMMGYFLEILVSGFFFTGVYGAVLLLTGERPWRTVFRKSPD